MLLEINIDDSLFVLINIYNANNEPNQVKTLTELAEILDCVGDIQNKNIIFGGDSNVIFYSFHEPQGRKPSLKKYILAKTILKYKKGKVQPF